MCSWQIVVLYTEVAQEFLWSMCVPDRLLFSILKWPRIPVKHVCSWQIVVLFTEVAQNSCEACVFLTDCCSLYWSGPEFLLSMCVPDRLLFSLLKLPRIPVKHVCSWKIVALFTKVAQEFLWSMCVLDRLLFSLLKWPKNSCEACAFLTDCCSLY